MDVGRNRDDGRQLHAEIRAAWTLQETGNRRRAFEQIVRATTKVIGGIAARVFFRAPFTNTGLALKAGSVVVGLACFAAYLWAEPDDDPEHSN